MTLFLLARQEDSRQLRFRVIKCAQPSFLVWQFTWWLDEWWHSSVFLFADDWWLDEWWHSSVFLFADNWLVRRMVALECFSLFTKYRDNSPKNNQHSQNSQNMRTRLPIDYHVDNTTGPKINSSFSNCLPGDNLREGFLYIHRKLSPEPNGLQ